MSKTLPNILTVFKVVRIIAKVVFILCIIGGIGCLLGLLTLPMAGALAESVLFDEGLDLSAAYLGCIVGFVACAGEAVFAFLAERYFKNVLNAGTPFTFESAKEIFRLGIISIIISVAIAVISGIAAFAIYLFSAPTTAEFDSSTSVSISTGLVFLFLSLIFKHGAEIQQAYAEKTYAENTYSEEAKQEEQKSESEAL